MTYIITRYNYDIPIPEGTIKVKVRNLNQDQYDKIKWIDSIKFLDCSCNQLTDLGDLPSSLINLNCWNNQLINLGELPSSLEHLYCSKNKLTSIPFIPNSIKEINISNNNFKNYSLNKIRLFQTIRIHIRCLQFIHKLKYRNVSRKQYTHIQLMDSITLRPPKTKSDLGGIEFQDKLDEIMQLMGSS